MSSSRCGCFEGCHRFLQPFVAQDNSLAVDYLYQLLDYPLNNYVSRSALNKGPNVLSGLVHQLLPRLSGRPGAVGVTITFLAVSRTLPSTGGSEVRTSKPAPAIRPLFKAAARASSSTILRAVLITIAVGFILLNASASIRLAGLSGQRTVHCDEVRLAEDGFQVRVGVVCPSNPNDVVSQHPHPNLRQSVPLPSRSYPGR